MSSPLPFNVAARLAHLLVVMSADPLAEMMADIDFCMMTTRGEGGAFHTRPMSNNGEVELDGDTWFFSSKETAKVVEDVDLKKELWVDELGRSWWSFEGQREVEITRSRSSVRRAG